MSYQLRRIRLVNLHNFVDETIELRDGGHLFLLGDNGSGKTTVLDAVHDVLAGGELEWNAAARIGGRRDEGRSLQGIVLRFDTERGVRRPGGSIAYAAIELVDSASGRVVSLGIGTEATTMDARVSRWGFIANRTLDEIALVDGDDRPCERDALRRSLGAAAVFAPLAAFRKEVARRFFGSDAQYADAVRFWGMAKAYREIVASARDFGALFGRLLPAPDGEIFDEILRALTAIDDLELALRDLDDQAGYVRGLVALADEVGLAREAAARYEWLACVRELEAVATAETTALDDAQRGRERATGLQAEVDVARAERERADEILRRVERADASQAALALRDAEARQRELDADHRQRRDDLARAEREVQSAARVADEHRREAIALTASITAELRRAVDLVAELPGDLSSICALADQLEAAREPPILVDTAPAIATAAAARARADARRVTADVGHQHARTTRERAEATHAELLASDDGGTRLQREAVAALAAAGLTAIPLCELLDPIVSADPAAVAGLERMVGEDVLAALVIAQDTDGGATRRAKDVLAVAGVPVHVVVATSAIPLPPWCAALFGENVPSGPAGRALATALVQPGDLGPVSAPDRWATLRGIDRVAPPPPPRWLGAEARRQARAQAIDHAARAAMAARAVEADHAARADLARRTVEHAARLERASAACVAGPQVRAWQQVEAASYRALLAGRVRDDAADRAQRVAVRVAALASDVAALGARLGGADAAELERRLRKLRTRLTAAVARVQASEHELAAAHAEVTIATQRARGHATERALIGERLVAANAALRHQLRAIESALAIADDDTLAHYVRVTQRGDSFRGIETLRSRRAEVQRVADANADELERDGARGVRYLAHAPQFGFTYDRVRNQLADRRDQPALGVLAELERTIAEQRSVINDKTRTLMDTLVMGSLASHLQGQVATLEQTIRGINRVLAGLRFGPSQYQFRVTPRVERVELLDLIRRLSILDDDSQRQFRAWIDLHLDDLRAQGGERDIGAVPTLLDYRRWFDFKLHVQSSTDDGVELTQKLRQVGSGGEQGVPNYLLVLALAKLMFDAAGALVRPLLFDEAFYGIDAGRRDQLLRLATDLDLQLLVASPDQDGATPAVRAATTLFVVKDTDGDVHLAPYHYWNRGREPQAGLFEPAPANADDAACTIAAPAIDMRAHDP